MAEPILDFHTHIFAPEVVAGRDRWRARDRWFGQLYANPRARLATGDDLLASMDGAGVAQAVIFGWAFADMGLSHETNDYVLAMARQHPQRLIPFAQVNPLAGDGAVYELERCLAQGARGVGELMPDGQSFALDEPGPLDGLIALATARRVPVLIHTNEQVGHAYAGKGAHGPEQAYRLAQRHPEATLVLAHWGGGLLFYELMPEVREVLRNVYYDTAASLYLYDDAIFGQAMRWAPDKVLLGTDYPLISQRRFLRHVRQAGLDEDALTRLMGANARRLLGIATPEIGEEG